MSSEPYDYGYVIWKFLNSNNSALSFIINIMKFSPFYYFCSKSGAIDNTFVYDLALILPKIIGYNETF